MMLKVVLKMMLTVMLEVVLKVVHAEGGVLSSPGCGCVVLH